MLFGRREQSLHPHFCHLSFSGVSRAFFFFFPRARVVWSLRVAAVPQSSRSSGPGTPLSSPCPPSGKPWWHREDLVAQRVTGSDGTFRDKFRWKSSLFTHLQDFKRWSDISALFFTSQPRWCRHGIELVCDWSFVRTKVQILVRSFLMNILELFLCEYLRDLYPLAAFHKSAARFSLLEIPAVKELGFSPVACLCYKCSSFTLN